MTADQAREIVDKKIKVNYTLNDIYNLIEEQAEKGLTYLILEGNIGEQIANELQKNGFKVGFSRFPTKCNPNFIEYHIDWKSADNYN